MKQTGTDRRKGDGIFLVLLFIETKGSCYCLALSSLIPRPKSSFPSFAWFPGNWISRERDLFRLLRWSMKSTQSVQLNNIWRCVRPKKPVIHILWNTNKYNHEWNPTYFDASSLKLLIQAQICALEAGAPNGNFRENICSEDNLRSRIFGAFVVKFSACLPLLGFSKIYKMV